MNKRARAWVTGQVYEHAEVLFARLGEEQKKLSDWVVLGTVDLDEFCDNHLDEVADWENNFRMLKGASKDAEKLPNEAKIDCYMVSTEPARAQGAGGTRSLQGQPQSPRECGDEW